MINNTISFLLKILYNDYGDDMENVQYIIVFGILFIIALALIKANRNDFKLELNKLVEYLGGVNNIISTEVNTSRFVVEVKDIELVKKNSIIKLGAKGIVEVDNQLKIILGDNSNKLKKYIEELK